MGNSGMDNRIRWAQQGKQVLCRPGLEEWSVSQIVSQIAVTLCKSHFHTNATDVVFVCYVLCTRGLHGFTSILSTTLVYFSLLHASPAFFCQSLAFPSWEHSDKWEHSIPIAVLTGCSEKDHRALVPWTRQKFWRRTKNKCGSSRLSLMESASCSALFRDKSAPVICPVSHLLALLPFLTSSFLPSSTFSTFFLKIARTTLIDRLTWGRVVLHVSFVSGSNVPLISQLFSHFPAFCCWSFVFLSYRLGNESWS